LARGYNSYARKFLSLVEARCVVFTALPSSNSHHPRYFYRPERARLLSQELDTFFIAPDLPNLRTTAPTSGSFERHSLV